MDLFWLIIGVFFTTLFFILIIVIVWFMNFMHKMTHNKLIRINNKTAGSDSIEWYRGKLKKHSTLGEVYYLPQLRKEDRHYIPFFGKSYEYPTNKNKVSYVPLSFLDGTYAPEKYDHTEKKEIDVIKKFIIDKESGEKVEFNSEKHKDYKGKVLFNKVKEEVISYVIKPTKYSMRQFNLKMDTAIKDDFMLNPGFWEKYGGYVTALGMVFAGVVLAIIMIVFAYQWGVDISQSTPAWVEGLVKGLTESGGIAPPPVGGSS